MRTVFRKNEIIEANARQYLFESAISLEQIVAVDPLSGDKTVFALSDVRSVEAKVAAKATAVSMIDPRQWAVAKKRFAAIQPLLERDRAPDAYKQVATRAGVNVATIYRWRKRFLRSGLLSSLLPGKPGVIQGSTRLGESVEAILDDLIQTSWMKDPRMRFCDFYHDLTERCRTAGLSAPHENTLRKRLAKYTKTRSKEENELNPDQILSRPLGSLCAEYPLEIVQVDHTKLDVFLVDEVFRLPLGRPWVTVAIDVATRSVVAFYLSFDPPGANSVGLCLFRAMTRKAEWLRTLGVESSWPMYGLPVTVYADNAKEFRGEMLSSVCEEYGINLQWRPVRKPRWGGHIERLMGVFSREMKALPGATFSNPKERGDYDSEAKAVMTLKELEKFLVSLLCDTYHQRSHRALGKSPYAAWQHGTIGPGGIGLPRTVADELRLRLNLLPAFERTISEYGVVLDNIHYYSDALRPYVGAVLPGRHRIRRKFQFRRDPRVISVLYFLDPESNQFLEIPYRDTSRPPVSVWELRAAAKNLKDSGSDEHTEEMLFAAVKKRRGLVADATHRTKQARRDRELQRRHGEDKISLPEPNSRESNMPPVSNTPPSMYPGIRLL